MDSPGKKELYLYDVQQAGLQTFPVLYFRNCQTQIIMNHVRRIIYFCCYCLGVIRLFYFINRKKQRVLVFHHIIPDKYINGSFEQDIVCTPCSKFAWIMSIVNRRFKVTTEPGVPGSAVITFDDGYRATLSADEILEKSETRACFFIPIANVGAGPLWIDRMMAWFAYVPEGSYMICGERADLHDPAGRRKAYSSFADGLYEGKYGKESLVRALDDLYPYERLPIAEEYRDLRFKGLSREEIETLKEKGHKIGGHSVNHDILSLLDEDGLRNDFSVCAAQIGILFNSGLYAYPYGHKRDVSQSVIRACRDSAFAYAFVNEYNPDATDYSLSRLNISHYTSRYEIEASLSGLIRAVKNLSGRLKTDGLKKQR